MKPKYLLLYFLLFLIFFSVVIIPFSRAILNENDINFEWITTKIYDNQNLVDYDVSDTVNYVQYNNSDYFEHANAFDSFNYTSDIYQYELYNFFESENYVDLYWNGSYFYLLNF